MARSCTIKIDAGKVTFESNGISVEEAWGCMNKIFIQEAGREVLKEDDPQGN